MVAKQEIAINSKPLKYSFKNGENSPPTSMAKVKTKRAISKRSIFTLFRYAMMLNIKHIAKRLKEAIAITEFEIRVASRKVMLAHKKAGREGVRSSKKTKVKHPARQINKMPTS